MTRITPAPRPSPKPGILATEQGTTGAAMMDAILRSLSRELAKHLTARSGIPRDVRRAREAQLRRISELREELREWASDHEALVLAAADLVRAAGEPTNLRNVGRMAAELEKVMPIDPPRALLAVVCSLLQREDASIPPAPGGEPLPASQAFATPHFDGWLRELERQPPEWPGWDEADGFGDAVCELAHARIAQRSAVQEELRSALSALGMHAHLLEFLERSDCLAWSSDGLEGGAVAEALRRVLDLQSALVEHSQASQNGRAARNAAEEKIDRACANAAPFFSAGTQRRIENPDQLTVASVIEAAVVAAANPSDSPPPPNPPAGPRHDARVSSGTPGSEEVGGPIAPPLGNPGRCDDVTLEVPVFAVPDTLPEPETTRWPAVEAATLEEGRTQSEAGQAESDNDDGAVLFDLVRHGHYSLAYHYSRALEQSGSAAPLPADLLRLLLVGWEVRSSYGPLVEDLRETVERLVSRLSEVGQWEEASALLGFAAAARPSLLAHASLAPAFLELIDLPIESLGELRAALIRFGRIGPELTPAVLKGVRVEAAWKGDLDDARANCENWLQKQKQSRLLFSGATNVWRRISAPDGELGQLFLKAVDGNPDASAVAIKRTLANWSSDAGWDDLFHRVDRRVRPALAERSPIEARALRDLRTHAHGARRILETWCEVAEKRPQKTSHPRLDEFRKDVVQALARAISHAGSADSQSDSRSLAVAQRALADSLHRLQELFDPNHPDVAGARESAINDGLLHLPNVSLDEHGGPAEGMAGAILGAIHELRPFSRLSWAEAHARQLDCENFDAAGRIVSLVPPGEVANFIPADKRLRDARQRLSGELNDIRASVAAAIACDLITESEYQHLLQTVESIQVEATLDFRRVRRELEGVSAQLSAKRELRIGEAKDRLARENLPPLDVDRIHQLLAAGDFLAANESIDLAIGGEELPSVSKRRDAFAAFFPAFVSAWTTPPTSGPTTNVQEAARIVRQRRQSGVVDATRLEQREASSGADLLDAWARIGRGSPRDAVQRTNLAKAIEEFFRAVGFANPKCTPSENAPASSWVGDMVVDAVGSRHLCAVPRFGSSARGQYRLLCLWGELREDAIIEHATRSEGGRALFVLYSGSLPVNRRREFARLCRSRGATFLLLDTALAVFLSLEPGSRVASLFASTLPFAPVDPYVTTAGMVPPEMFFGRESEQASIVDRSGTNLVYGGRQLGKTALLRHVERTHHNPGAGRVVCWIDLKHHMIGTHHAIEDIWQLLSKKLLPSVGQSSAADRVSDPDTLFRRLREWLSQSDRQILVLLDEADAFLASDRKQDWKIIGRLKGLMDETHRQFKVVFAGLHDVQRTSRDVNTPLAHFGEPICVGPLLGSGEHRAALELIESPLAALGYRFESPDLPLRILSHTNYYPSLTQLFCKALLEHLSSRATFNYATSPPYCVTSKHIDEAYRDPQLRKQILDRFKWTLDLDPRYRVIALLIADATAEQTGVFPRQGFDTQWIRDRVLRDWPLGFKEDASLEAFATVLDEMVGLGILRRSFGASYALRNANVLNFFGTRTEVAQALLDAIDKEPQPYEYDATTFRRGLAERATRSALTVNQESDILARQSGTVVVFGTQLGGLQHVLEDLQVAAGAVPVQRVLQLESPRAIDAKLEALWHEHGDGSLVVAVPDDVLWSPETVKCAAEFCRERRSTKKSIRVVFFGGPGDAWSWVQRPTTADASLLGLRPWSRAFAKQWVDDEYHMTFSHEDLLDATGGWSGAIRRLRVRLGDDSRHWVERLAQLRTTEEWTRAFVQELELPEPMRGILTAFAKLNGDVSEEELAELESDRWSAEQVSSVFRCADLLALVQRVGSAWRLDPFVAKLLSHGHE